MDGLVLADDSGHLLRVALPIPAIGPTYDLREGQTYVVTARIRPDTRPQWLTDEWAIRAFSTGRQSHALIREGLREVAAPDSGL